MESVSGAEVEQVGQTMSAAQRMEIVDAIYRPPTFETCSVGAWVKFYQQWEWYKMQGGQRRLLWQVAPAVLLLLARRWGVDAREMRRTWSDDKFVQEVERRFAPRSREQVVSLLSSIKMSPSEQFDVDATVMYIMQWEQAYYRVMGKHPASDGKKEMTPAVEDEDAAGLVEDRPRVNPPRQQLAAIFCAGLQPKRLRELVEAEGHSWVERALNRAVELCDKCNEAVQLLYPSGKMPTQKKMDVSKKKEELKRQMEKEARESIVPPPDVPRFAAQSVLGPRHPAVRKECYECGSLDHIAPTCPIKAARKKREYDERQRRVQGTCHHPLICLYRFQQSASSSEIHGSQPNQPPGLEMRQGESARQERLGVRGWLIIERLDIVNIHFHPNLSPP